VKYFISGNTFRGDKTSIRLSKTWNHYIARNNFVKAGTLIESDVNVPISSLFWENNIGDIDRVEPDSLATKGINWWKKRLPEVQYALDRPVEIEPYASSEPPPDVPGNMEAFLQIRTLRGRKYIFVDEWGPRRPDDPKVAEERAKAAVNLARNWKVVFYEWPSAGPKSPPADWESVKSGNEVEIEAAATLDYRWPGKPTKDVPADFFATVATTEVELEAGKYEIRTISDDGIRVTVDDKVVIEDWTWHPPKTHTATLTLSKGKHSILVEHFEIDGFAQLSVRLRPAR
jgi:hypothetical protein